MIFPRLNLLQCVELRAGPGGRAAFLRRLGISERRFNSLVGGRAEPTAAEKRTLLAEIPESEFDLFFQSFRVTVRLAGPGPETKRQSSRACCRPGLPA